MKDPETSQQVYTDVIPLVFCQGDQRHLNDFTKGKKEYSDSSDPITCGPQNTLETQSPEHCHGSQLE